MNANFVFPAKQVPTLRPQKLEDGTSHISRDSNTLRQSVLDAALQLGIGSNSLVADWMFNNAVHEEDENEVCMNFQFSFRMSLVDDVQLESRQP